MGKKDNEGNKKKDKVKSMVESHILDEAMIRRKSRELKQFLWSCLKENRVSMKSEAVIRQYTNKISGNANIDGQIETMLKETKLYLKTKQIFKSISLKDKYSHLLKGNSEQVKEQQKEPLTEQEASWMKQVNKIYDKYKVSSMFKHNLLKEIEEGELDSVLAKGYLKEINLRGNGEFKVIFLAS